MSFALHGLAISQGIAIGRAHLISHATLEVFHYLIPHRQIDAELARFDAAIAEVQNELLALRHTASEEGAPAELSAFVDLHALLLADPLLSVVPRDRIRERRCNAEWALVQQMEELVSQFEQIEDPYLRERKADVIQVVERVVKALLGRRGGMPHKRPSGDDVIVVAHDLSPADTLQFKGQRIAAFVTDLGGATSHTAIVARSLGIPAIVGMVRARELLRDDDILIVDGTRGVLLVDPEPVVIEEYRLRRTQLELERNQLKRLRAAPCKSLDGESVCLEANIETPGDAIVAHDAAADGIGLFRTEFLFMNRDTLPSEDEQFESYLSVINTMKGRPVTIRTLDVGADKTLRQIERSELNPALGLRAIRYCLAEPQLFLTQLRAILRAANHGWVRILLPMLAHTHEITQSLAMIARAREQLRKRGERVPDRVEVGGMVEIPAAVLALGPFLKHLDFLSIGTNDLIQYTLAIDRSDEAVSALYDPLHPAVLRLITQAVQTARRAGVTVSLCGEMAGEPAFARLLLGIGLRHLSMHPRQLLEIKREVLHADIGALTPRVARLLRLDEPARIRSDLRRINTLG